MAIGTISSPASWSLGTVVSPSFLQNVMDNVNGFIAGTDSLLGLVVDGVGGQTVTPVAGAVKTTTNLISTSTPNPASNPGTVYKDLVPVAGGFITNSGSPAIGCGFGISSVSLAGTGQVTVNLLNTLASISKCFAVITPAFSGTAVWVSGNTTTTSILVQTTNTSFTNTNGNFSFVLYGSV